MEEAYDNECDVARSGFAPGLKACNCVVEPSPQQTPFSCVPCTVAAVPWALAAAKAKKTERSRKNVQARQEMWLDPVALEPTGAEGGLSATTHTTSLAREPTTSTASGQKGQTLSRTHEVAVEASEVAPTRAAHLETRALAKLADWRKARDGKLFTKKQFLKYYWAG